MKSIFLILTFVAVIISCVAQKNVPAFGKIDKADLVMTECAFDKGAEAMVLIDYGNTYYDRGTVGYSIFKTVMERRTRIKILKKNGIEQADVRINYYNKNNEEKITRLNAITYNLDDDSAIKTTEVKKSAIYSKKIDGSFSAIIIVFPKVKVGSVIEYSYTIERETIHLSDWFFQGKIPVRHSEYQLKIPQFFRFSLQASTIDPVEDKQQILTERISLDEGVVEAKVLKSNYIMRNISAIKYEPFMGTPKDYMQRLEFQLTQIDYGTSSVDISTKWSDVIRDLNKNENFGVQLNKDLSNASGLIEEAKKINDPESRIKFIYHQLRKAIIWNGEDDIYTDIGITKAWETKSGNTADINLLFVKLLKDAGINASPILLSTRNHGLVNAAYHFVSQFNTVMAYVQINNKYLVLDATDKISNYKMIPERIVNTTGFIVEGENGSCKNILAGKYKYKVMAAISGQIDSTGLMKADGLINCFDYARKQRCEKWLGNKQSFIAEYFTNTNFKIEDFIINNTDTDSLPLEQKIKFTTLLNSSGNYKYFTVNMFSDLDNNPFVAEERVADIDFGFQQDYTIFGKYTISKEYVFDALPENTVMIMPDTSIIFTRSMQVEENLLNVRISVEFKKAFYTAADYGLFKEFYKNMFIKLNEQVVIKKISE